MTIAALRNVYKSFGEIPALVGVSLEMAPGELLALLGPNGAGKTTAIRLLLGHYRPDSGEARLFGRDPTDPKSRLWIGATPQEMSFPTTLTVREVVELVQAHYPQRSPPEKLLDRVGLAELGKRQTGGLSGGQKRRLAAALAFAGNPLAVFLDEPTTGLDVEARRAIWQTIQTYVEDGGSVLLTTHYLEEVEALATRVVVIHKGQTVAEGTVREITARVGLQRVRIKSVTLPELPAVTRVIEQNGSFLIYTTDADRVVRELVRTNVPFRDLEVHPASLEDAFQQLTEGR